MEPAWHKTVLTAESFAGGLHREIYTARERFTPQGGLRGGQVSSCRSVVTVAGAGRPGNQVQTGFYYDKGHLPTKNRHGQVFLRVRGMWDHQRDLEAGFATLHKLMPTFGRFRISINERTVLDGSVFYWNYRQWRFWPSLELPVDADVLQPGPNTLVFENLTLPFFENIPEKYKPLFPSLDPNKVPLEIRANTTFHLSDIHLLTRRQDDLAVLTAPDIVRCGELFRVELYATRPHDLAFTLPDGASVRSEARLTVGRNTLWFQANAPGAHIVIQGQSRVTGRSFAVRIVQAVAAARPETEFLLGHTLGGHRSAFAVEDDYRFLVELFRDTGQGNLVMWLASPAKAGDWITADRLPIEDIRRTGLRAGFRYYGGFPPGVSYPDEIRRCIDQLGDSFVGLAPHEAGSRMRVWLGEGKPRNEALTGFAEGLRSNLAELRGTAAGQGLAWVTDPSQYAHVYRKVGFDRAGLELFPLHCNLNIASVRGTCRMYGDPGWAAINSFECQAYGGLAMPEPMADLDERFDDKRANLWWFSQHHLYLSGARTIYSESGAFHQVVTRHLELEDPRCVRFRAAQRQLWNFAQFHGLDGQPAAPFAFVRSETDAFCDKYGPVAARTESADLTWERVRVVWPQLRWHNERLRALTATAHDRMDYSDTPFGEADIVTLSARPEVLESYRALALVGRHALAAPDIGRLEAYVQSGGQVVVNLADFDDAEGLYRLTGCRRTAPGSAGFLWQVEAADRAFIADFSFLGTSCHISTGAYHGVEQGDLVPEGPEQVVLRDQLTRRPLLIRRPLGRGAVWLINVAEYPDSREYQLLANGIVRGIFARTAKTVTLCRGSFISFFQYPGGTDGRGFHRLFALNNNWYAVLDRHPGVFSFDGITFLLTTRRNKVRQAFLLPGRVIVPSSSWLRLDDCREPIPGQLQVDLQGRDEVILTMYGTSRVRRAVLDTEPLDVQCAEDRQTVTVHLKGKHTLRIE